MDGNGKSTLVRKVAEELDAKGKTVQTQAFPSRDGVIGQFIREAIFTGAAKVDERAMLPLMVADAIDFDAKLLKWREEFDFLLLDRHSIISAWAYQLGPHTHDAVAALASPTLFSCLPDVIFVLDAEPDVVMERMKARGEKTNPLYERDVEYAMRLRSRYLATVSLFADTVPIMTIDSGRNTPELLSGIIIDALTTMLDQREAA
jgi:thymidylate kinase